MIIMLILVGVIFGGIFGYKAFTGYMTQLSHMVKSL